MNSLIFSDQTVLALTELWSAYKENKLIRAKSLKSFEFTKFSPLFSNELVYKNIHSESIERLIKNANFLPKTKSDLELRGALYSESTIIEPLNSIEFNLSVNSDLFVRNSSAIAEIEVALEMIYEIANWQSNLLQSLVEEICFIKNTQKGDRSNQGFSSYDLMGVIFVSLCTPPHKELKLAIAIIHELGHQALQVLQAGQNPIHKSSHEQWVYSGVRKTERPALKALHAAVALGYMYCFCINVLDKIDLSKNEISFIDNKKNDIYLSLGKAVVALKSVKFNPLGKRLLQDLESMYNNK